MVIGILLGLIAIFVATIGMKCMKCMEDDEVQKMRMAVIGGVIFLIAGLAVLVATAWYGNRIVQDFYDPMTPVNARYEFGQALFTGWAAASLCLLGGALLCCSCPRKTTSYPTPRPYPKPAPSSGKDYVWHGSKRRWRCWHKEEMDIEILLLTLRPQTLDFCSLNCGIANNRQMQKQNKKHIFLKYASLKMP